MGVGEGFLPLKYLAISGGIFGCHNWGVIKREDRDAVKHSTMYRTAPCKKELSDPKCYSADIEKPCTRLTMSLLQPSKS